jgi:hypothetical protein
MNLPSDLTLAQTLAHSQPVPNPAASLLWHALVDIGPRQDLGTGPLGARGLIPITGGVFWAGPAAGALALQGRVLAGGADRQLQRSDGVRELDALYDMQAEDGTLLTVHNQVLIDEVSTPGQRYARSLVRVTAPQGPFAWLSRRILIGTLQPLMPARQAVLIRVFVID